MPASDRTPLENRAGPGGTFQVSPQTLQWDGLTQNSALMVRSDSVTPETFTVRKVSHRAYDATGRLLEERGAAEAPLSMVELRIGDDGSATDALSFVVPARCVSKCPEIRVRLTKPMPVAWARFDAVLQIEHPRFGQRDIQLHYAASVEGRWTGSMHYFANFGTKGLDRWQKQADKSDARTVANGLIRRWADFRRGNLGGSFGELRAVLTATESETWRSPSVRRDCPGNAEHCGGACYLYDSGRVRDSGLRAYVSNVCDAPIPTGELEFPFAMDLRAAPDGALKLVGTIDSAVSLHMAGTPAVALSFASSPLDPAFCNSDGISGACVSFLRDFSASVRVGGRLFAAAGQDCPEHFSKVAVPWLVPGFHAETFQDAASGTRYRHECRDRRFPWTTAGTGPLNASMTGANPIADGQARSRELRMVDGAMIDQRTLLVFFEERFGRFFGPDSFSAYGYLWLERTPNATLPPRTDAGLLAPLPEKALPSRESLTCDPALLEQAFGAPTKLTVSNAVQVASTLLTGRRPGTTEPQPDGAVHYLCEETGVLDGGPDHRGTATDHRLPCPTTSRVLYFTLRDGSQQEVAGQACQQNGTCSTTLTRWLGIARK